MQFYDYLMFPAVQATSRDELLTLLGGAIIDAGLAREDYVTALIERESSFPTGLPISGGVAIPHTSAEYVTGDTIAVATLPRSVAFGEMGGEEGNTVDVTVVFLLVLANASAHASVLGSVIRKVQDEEFVAALREAPTGIQLVSLLSQIITD